MAKSLISAAVKLGYIDRAQKEKIQKYREETGRSEDSALRDTKIISEENILKLYSDVYRIPIGKIKDIKDTSLLQRLNSKELYRLSFIPEKSNDDILIYTAQPSNLLYAEDLIKETFELKGSFIHKLVSQKELNSFIAKLFEGSGAEALENFDIEGERRMIPPPWLILSIKFSATLLKKRCRTFTLNRSRTSLLCGFVRTELFMNT